RSRDDGGDLTAPESGIKALNQRDVGLAHRVLPFDKASYGECGARFHAGASARSISNAWALRPPRSIEAGASSRAIRCAARSRQRMASCAAPSASSLESRTMWTLHSMSSLDQPREWAI